MSTSTTEIRMNSDQPLKYKHCRLRVECARGWNIMCVVISQYPLAMTSAT